MKRLLLAGVVALALTGAIAGCGGSKTATETTAAGSASDAATTSTSASAGSGCSGSGLDAMTALSEFQLEMGDAQKAGKLTVDQLTAARDKIFKATEAAADKQDWVAYCQAIDDMRAELGL